MAKLEVIKMEREEIESASITILYKTSHRRDIYDLTLRSILRAKGVDAAIFVLNNPPDDSKEFLLNIINEELKRGVDKDIYIIESSKNLGFGNGNNLGYELAKSLGAKYVVLINDDFLVREEVIGELKEMLERTDYSGISGIVLNPDFTIQVYGSYLCHDRSRQPYQWKARKGIPLYPTYLCGCFSIYKVKDLEECGGLFLKPHFIYAEDTELGIRLWRCGKRIVEVPVVVGVHYQGTSMVGKKRRRDLRFSLALHRADGCVHAKRYPPSDPFTFLYSLIYFIETIATAPLPSMPLHLFMRLIGAIECWKEKTVAKEPRLLDPTCLLPITLRALYKAERLGKSKT
ncbi:hypothetical protein IPA_05715 [Ignicoccus pacificus DSM 13166]|uniref:Glycosyltransferase 2-like domain-containing protein n=1 Tax=Ignicoccus pacificus DSM 13166 TaxID=940294 RepID=A0A977KCB6_9CREN|nr:hypothetical protein IPA_05715 [Ignicoccus pacificus DSM 13166]